MGRLVIVESPAKARTINRYLGSDYDVLASYGHVRDLEAKDGSVRPDEDFAMSWQVDKRAAPRLAEIRKALAKADRLILATDPDREGEAIAWHLTESLAGKTLSKIPVERVAFNAITREAVEEAMRHPRPLDRELIDAYLARRALDYLVGFTLSPVLWRKLPGARSAGRVQSVALRLVCEREMEREDFREQEYWTVEADMESDGKTFSAALIALDGKKLGKFDLANEAAAHAARDKIAAARWRVESIETKQVQRRPQAPFTTSSLQQEAFNRLGWTAKRTMQVAQRLYEGSSLTGEQAGLITYMRTDGVQITPQALKQVRGVIGKNYGADYLPSSPYLYKTKAKNAQEAHEAIRPASFARPPAALKGQIKIEDSALYELIWNRTLASQMAPARIERNQINLNDDADDVLRATGSRIVFPGFLKIYGGQRKASEKEEQILPQLEKGAECEVKDASATQHFTQPPPRYSEASLVKRMEELGIGRPSTYAPILSVLVDRGYTRLEKRQLAPESRGRVVTAFLEHFFKRYVDYDFTAALEENLDKISAGEISWRRVLADFWRDFAAKTDGIKELRISEVIDHLNTVLAPYVFRAAEEGGDPRKCPRCGEGQLSIRLGRYGAFIGCGKYPDCRYIRDLSPNSENGDAKAPIDAEGRALGEDPLGAQIFVKTGPFGPYVEKTNDEGKTKRASLPKTLAPEEVKLEQAIDLLALPREVGEHPRDGKMIRAGVGRFGPYVVHDGLFVSLRGDDDALTIGLNRAVTLIADKEAKGGRKKLEARKKAAAKKKAASKKKTAAKKKPAAKRKTTAKRKTAARKKAAS